MAVSKSVLRLWKNQPLESLGSNRHWSATYRNHPRWWSEYPHHGELSSYQEQPHSGDQDRDWALVPGINDKTLCNKMCCSETHQFLFNKSNEPVLVNRSFKYVMGNNAVNSEGRQNRVALASHKGCAMNTCCSNSAPSIPTLISGVIDAGLIYPYKVLLGNVTILALPSCTKQLISFCCSNWDLFPANCHSSNCTRNSCNRDINTSLTKEPVLNLIKIESWICLKNRLDECQILESENAWMRAQVGLRVIDCSIFSM